MKPRLESALPTLEDRAVWEHIYPRLARGVTGWRFNWFTNCMHADRRDADRMLALGLSWATLTNHMPEPQLARTQRRLMWLLQRGYGSGLNTLPHDIVCFA